MQLKLSNIIKVLRGEVDKIKEMNDFEKKVFFENKSDSDILKIISKMKTDDAVDCLKVLELKKAKKLIKLMNPKKAKEISFLFKFPEDVAGSLMQKEFVSVEENFSVEDAINKVRNFDDDSLHNVYIVDSIGVLKGVVSLRKLVVNDSKKSLKDLMNSKVIFAFSAEPLEEIINRMKEFDLIVLPVVDENHLLQGIITIDDIVDVIGEEVTKDIHQLGGLSGDSDEYFSLNLIKKVQKRIPWILILLFAGIVSGGILSFYELTLSEMVILAFFIPLLMDTAGNVSSQAVTLAVRGIATGELKSKKVIQIISQELSSTFLIALIISFATMIISFFYANMISISLTVGVSMFLIVLTANLIGFLMPFLLKKINIDPAVASAPLLTTISDVVGLLIYFESAKFFLGL